MASSYITIPKNKLDLMTRAQRGEIERTLTLLCERNPVQRVDRIDDTDEDNPFEGPRYFTTDDTIAVALTATAREGYSGFLKHKEYINNLITL